MSSSPISPHLIKGKIIAVDPSNSRLICTIDFQYNPEMIVRTLSPNWKVDDSMYIVSPPEETINITIELDATDQLEKGDPIATEFGIYPALSALETLIYPESKLITENPQPLAEGRNMMVPYESPLVLFIWGTKRTIPIQITGLTISEQEHDNNLNPIRAVVSLGMHVLDYGDFPLKHPGFEYFKTYHQLKEQMASLCRTTKGTEEVP